MNLDPNRRRDAHRLLTLARSLTARDRPRVEPLALAALQRGRDVDRLDVVAVLRDGTLSIAVMRAHLARHAPDLLAAFEECVRDARARPGWLRAHHGRS